MIDLIWGFLTPKQRERIEQQEREHNERLCEEAVPWDESMKFQKQLAIDGTTYDAGRYTIFDSDTVPATAKLPEIEKQALWSPHRTFAYVNREYPALTRLQTAQGNREGWVIFSTPVTIPILYEHRRGELKVWMSFTPMEVLTQKAAIRKATGDVLIGGLGLGYLLKRVAEKKSVKRIIVVEKSDELLDWYGRELCEQVAEESGTPVEVICDDVLNQMGKHGDDVRHLVDIWPDYPNEYCYLSREWQAAIKSVKHFWGWGVFGV